jgi:hypothetical protein
VKLETPPFSTVAKSLPLYVTEYYGFVADPWLLEPGRLSLRLCGHILNIVVLTRREMRTPTNALLTGLAVADFLVMLDYIPFACHKYMRQNIEGTDSDEFTYASAYFLLFHAHFSQVILLETLNCLLWYSQQSDGGNVWA